MTEDSPEVLPDDIAEQQSDRAPPQSGASETTRAAPEASGAGLDRAFASEYLDELILAVLLRRGEANGMEIIREFTRLFGVQFSPGTVYPHLHSLEKEGILACRECVQTKEYRIDDAESAEECIDAALAQMSRLSAFLGTTPSDD